MKINKTVYDELTKIAPIVPPITSGILCGFSDEITGYDFYVGTAYADGDTGCPDSEYLNSLLEEWDGQGITLCGVFRTHASGETRLTDAEKLYIFKTLNDIPYGLQSLVFAVVNPLEKTSFYNASLKDGRVHISLENTVITER